jgi:hypothetical protein
MKKSLPLLLAALAFIVALPATRAADDDKFEPKTEKKSLRVISGPDHGVVIHRTAEAEKEPTTFLGVETGPVPASLTTQLGLQDGAGLVVNHVVPDSPAAGALKQHDVLLKLDDQILIEQRQLLVLVRGHKEGDEVTLTFLRGGKQATAKLKLTKRDMPKMSLNSGMPGDVFAPFVGAPAANGMNFRVFGNPDEEANRVLGLINGGLTLPGTQRMNIFSPAPGGRSINVTVNTGNSHVVLDDDAGSLDLTINEGKKQLVAKAKDGKEIFSGPIDTPEQRKALPEDVRRRLEKLEDSTQFSFKTGTDFKSDVKLGVPRGQGIALPPQPPAPARAPNFF